MLSCYETDRSDRLRHVNRRDETRTFLDPNRQLVMRYCHVTTSATQVWTCGREFDAKSIVCSFTSACGVFSCTTVTSVHAADDCVTGASRQPLSFRLRIIHRRDTRCNGRPCMSLKRWLLWLRCTTANRKSAKQLLDYIEMHLALTSIACWTSIPLHFSTGYRLRYCSPSIFVATVSHKKMTHTCSFSSYATFNLTARP